MEAVIQSRRVLIRDRERENSNKPDLEVAQRRRQHHLTWYLHKDVLMTNREVEHAYRNEH